MPRPAVSRSFGAMEIWESPDKTFSKHMLQDGQGDSTPNDGSVCCLNLMVIGDILPVDESLLGDYKFGEDCEVTIGEGDSLFAEFLDKVVCSMKEGERSYIKAKIDHQGQPVGELDKNAALKFNVHLFSFSRSADSADLEQDERLERAQHHKDQGTVLFKAGNVEYATKRYVKAISYVSDMGSASLADLPEVLVNQYNTLKCQCYLNLAACQAKIDKHEDVVKHCDQALLIEPNNVKGLFRRAQAHSKLNDFADAKADLQKAAGLEPGNKAVTNLLRSVEAAVLKEKQMYKKMFT